MAKYANSDEDIRFDLTVNLVNRFNGNIDFTQVETLFRYIKYGLLGVSANNNVDLPKVEEPKPEENENGDAKIKSKPTNGRK